MDSPIPPNLDGLIGLSRRHGVDIKPTLLRVLTDLYVQKPTHSTDEERQYTTLALRLLELVDADTRAIVTRTLAAYPGAPTAVLRHLAGEPGRSAAKAPPRAAGRPQEAPPQPAGPAAAPDLTASFFAADATERRLILANLQYADTVTFQRRLPVDSRSAVVQLERAVLGGRPGEVVRELERALGVSRMVAQRIVEDASGEPVVVAAKALDMPLAVLQRILLFVNPAIGHSVQRVYELCALFEDINPQSARHLVSLWRDPPANQPRRPHRPYALDEVRRARGEPAHGAERLATIDEDDDLFLDSA